MDHVLRMTLYGPPIIFQGLFDPSQPVDPDEVHGKALLVLVHPGAQDALGSDGHVDPGGVLPGNGHRLEHRVANFAVGPAVGQTDDRVGVIVMTGRDDGARLREQLRGV